MSSHPPLVLTAPSSRRFTSRSALQQRLARPRGRVRQSGGVRRLCEASGRLSYRCLLSVVTWCHSHIPDSPNRRFQGLKRTVKGAIANGTSDAGDHDVAAYTKARILIRSGHGNFFSAGLRLEEGAGWVPMTNAVAATPWALEGQASEGRGEGGEPCRRLRMFPDIKRHGKAAVKSPRSCHSG